MTKPETSTQKPSNSAAAKLDPVSIGKLLLLLFLSGLFLYSGGSKLLDPEAFQNEIANFEIISWKMAGALALALPWLEVFCALALFLRSFRHGALVILSSLMLLFIGVVASAWIRDLDVSCGCFGASNSSISYPWWILRNIGILAALSTVFILEKRGGAKPKPTGNRSV